LKNLRLLHIFILISVCFAFSLSVAYVPFDCGKALKTIFKNEGGYSSDPNDTGNFCKINGKRVNLGTKYGIAASVYGPYLVKQGKTIKGLTVQDAAFFYNRDYAQPLHLSEIRSQWLATMFLDTAVNCGTGTAAILITRTINVMNGKSEDFPVDPVVGKAEIDFINSFTESRWYEKEKDSSRRYLFGAVFKEMRARRYVQIVRRNPAMLRYLPTWMERTYN